MKKDFNKKYNELVKEYLDYITDQREPIEERWKELTKTPHLGKTSYRTNFGLDRDDSFLYDDKGPCYMEKYQTSEVKEILEMMLDDEDFALMPEEITQFKKFCVNNGFSYMKFDW